jgi:hypothetical protein
VQPFIGLILVGMLDVAVIGAAAWRSRRQKPIAGKATGK